jgi:hypothetical protein
MKIAIVHDWLTGIRGGEKCLEVFRRFYPEADLFTLPGLLPAFGSYPDNMKTCISIFGMV